MIRHPLSLLLSATLAASAAGAQTSAAVLTGCTQMGVGHEASLNGFVPFPASDPWNISVASASVDPDSANILSALGSSPVHPDFGSGLYYGSTIGIPYVVVSGQTRVNINFTAYGSQSDPGPMPIPSNAHIEGYPVPNGDRHVLVVDHENCFLYELYNSYLQSDGSWNADSAAVWDLLNDNDRPYTWTSADAAGLPVFPGLARYDEVAAGKITHALRFTVDNTRGNFVAPAVHSASNSFSAAFPPMGTRFRLKASFDTSKLTPQAKIIATALKTYGMILADNGSNLYISGAPDAGWNNDDLHNLNQVTAADFEVITLGPVYNGSNLPPGPSPVISSLQATVAGAPVKSVASGAAVTLTWESANVSYFVLSPTVGAVRGTSVVVHPTATTTYTLYANSHFGNVTKSVTVKVK